MKRQSANPNTNSLPLPPTGTSNRAERIALRPAPLDLDGNAQRPGFVDVDDARAFYAQHYADKMREKAKQTLAGKGLHSHYYPHTADLMPPNPPDEDKPMAEEEAIASYNRVRT